MKAKVIDVKNDNCRIYKADDDTRRYLDTIRLYLPLTREEEYAETNKYAKAVKALKELDGQVHCGTLSIHDYSVAKAENEKLRDEASDTIVKHNLRFVYAIAMRLGNQSNIQDLISEGVIGIMSALETFDNSLGNKFISHAVWYIRRNMVTYITETSHSVRFCRENIIVPKAKFFIGRYFSEHGTNPSTEEVREFLKKEHGLEVKSESDLMGVRMSSINETIDDDEGENRIEEYSEFAKRTAAHNDYMDTIDAEEKHLMIMNALNRLTEREREMVLYSFGLKDGREWTNYEIGQEFGLTAERVRQILAKATEKMSMDKRLAKAYRSL